MINRLNTIHFLNLNAVSSRYKRITNKNWSDFKNTLLLLVYGKSYYEIELTDYQNSYLSNPICWKADATIKNGFGNILDSQPKSFIDKYQKSTTNIEVLNFKHLFSDKSSILLHFAKSWEIKNDIILFLMICGVL